MRNTQIRRKFLSTVSAVVAALFANSANAALWVTPSGDTAWLNGANWSTTIVPGLAEVAQFGVDPTSATVGVGIDMGGATNNGATNQAVGAIEITSGRANNLIIGNSSTATNGTLTLNGATVNSVNNVVLSSSATGGTLTIQNIQGTGNKTMGVALANPQNVVTIDGAGGITVSSVISGVGSSLALQGTGTGTLVLSGANTFSGGVTLNSGVLTLGSSSVGTPPALTSGPLGTGTLTMNGGVLANGGTARTVGNAVTLATANNIFSPGTGGYTLSGVISGAAGNNFVKNGASSLTLSGANEFLGDTFVNGGSGAGNLIISNSSAFGSTAVPHNVTVTAGTVAGSSANTTVFLRNLASAPGTVSIPTNVTLTLKTTGDFRSGLFSDNTLGATTWNGPINIIGDALTGDGSAAFSAGSTVGGGPDAALVVNGDVTGSAFTGLLTLRGTTGSPLGIMNGKITLPLAAKVNKNDAGTWIINSTGNTWGTTTVERGILRLGADNVLPATVGIIINGINTGQTSTLDLNGKNQTIGGLVSAATQGTRSVDNPTATLSTLTINDTVDGTYGGISSITGNVAIVKSGSAVWTLGGSVANTHTGGTTVTAGTLKLAGTNSALGDATAPLTVNGGSVDVNGTSPTVGKLSGTGGTLVNDGAAASTLTFGDASNASFAGAIGGTASLSITKTGNGTQTLSGTNTYTGNTTVSVGTLDITGSHTTGANYAVATGAALVTNNVRVTNALTLDGTTTINANGGAAGASKVETLTIGAGGKLNLKNNDIVVGTGTVAAVRAAIKTGVAGATGITSDLPAFGISTGFGYALGNDAALSPLLAGNLTGQSYDADSVLVKYTFLGDADLDGDSDLNDLGLWAQSFTGDLGNPVTPVTFWTSGDFDYDGDTDLNDLGFWASTFTGDLGGGAGSLIVNAPNAPAGAVSALNSIGITVVPEPSTFVLAGLGILGLAIAARRSRQTRQ